MSFYKVFNLKTGFLCLMGMYLGYVSCHAQTIDSVRLSGKLEWKDKSITGFPAQLEISSLDDATFSVKTDIDSLGRYAINLAVGEYSIAPARNYHWIGEEYIRIDDTQSKIALELLGAKEYQAPILELDTIAWPELMPDIGVLHDFTPEKEALLDEFIKVYLRFFEIPGASIALIKNGKLIYHNVYGAKNSINLEAIEKETLFEAGSTTKPVFGFVMMRLVEKGIMDLDKPLYQYLPFEDVAHDERYKLITARLVLSHQTGFPNWARRNEKGQFGLLFTPGTKFRYSGEAFEYLKRVVEHVSGKEMNTILEEELIVPLNWQGVYFTGNEQVSELSANGHYNNKPVAKRIIEKPMMAFSMLTEAKSFSTFMLALRNKEVLKSKTYKEFFKIHSTREDSVHWGLGIQIENSAQGLVYGHSGSTSRGFVCNFRYFKDLDMGYAIFTNSQMGGFLSLPLLRQFLITGKDGEG